MCGYAAANRPFVCRTGQAVAGVETEHMARRVFAEIGTRRNRTAVFGIQIFAVVQRVACKQLPIVRQLAGNFHIHTAAAHTAYRLVIPARHDIVVYLNAAVFLHNIEQGHGSIQLALIPFTLPADFVIVAQYRGQIAFVAVFVAVRFEDAGVAGVYAVMRRDVVSDTEIRNKAVVFAAGHTIRIVIHRATGVVVIYHGFGG